MRIPWVLAVAVGSTACLPVGGHVTIRDEQSDPQVAQAAALAASIVGPLRELEASLDNWDQCLRAGSCTPEGFVRTTEAEVLRILAAPELAPLQDWVREGFVSVYRRWQLGSPGGGQRTVAFRPDPVPVQSPSATGLVGWVRALISQPRRMAEDRALLADLCVSSTPPQATFRMWPSSEPTQVKETITTGQLVNVYRGLFAFRLTKGTRSYACPDQQCAKLDLVADPRPVFNCSLDALACKRQEGVAVGCHG